MQTVSVAAQIRASAAIYEAALQDIEALSDVELGNILVNNTSDSTVARVACIRRCAAASARP